VHTPAFKERVDIPSFDVSSSSVKVKLSPGFTSARGDAPSDISVEVADASGEERARAERTVATTVQVDLVLILIKVIMWVDEEVCNTLK